MKLMSLLLAGFLALNTAASFAGDGEHPVGPITGNQINLQTADHAIAGSMKNFVMFGSLDEETGISNLIIRKDAQTINASFKKQDDGRFGGIIRHSVDNKEIVTSIYFVSANKTDQTITVKINDQDVVVSVIGEFKDNHFQNPSYKGTFNGEEISFSMQGTACYGFSFHLIAMIFGAYIH